MKSAIVEVLKEFYRDGVPSPIVPRDAEYGEKVRSATVVKGMRL